MSTETPDLPRMITALQESIPLCIATVICEALNRLIHKCPVPAHIIDGTTPPLDAWASYWIGELRKGPTPLPPIHWAPEAGAFQPVEK